MQRTSGSRLLRHPLKACCLFGQRAGYPPVFQMLKVIKDTRNGPEVAGANEFMLSFAASPRIKGFMKSWCKIAKRVHKFRPYLSIVGQCDVSYMANFKKHLIDEMGLPIIYGERRCLPPVQEYCCNRLHR